MRFGGAAKLVPLLGGWRGDESNGLEFFVLSWRRRYHEFDHTNGWVGVFLEAYACDYVSANDFDGDGITDPAKYDPAAGTLSWLKSSTGTWDSEDLGTDSYELVN